MHLILINGGHEGSPHRRLWALVGGNKGGRRLLPDDDDGFALGFALFHFGERLVDLFERVDRVDGGFQRWSLSNNLPIASSWRPSSCTNRKS